MKNKATKGVLSLLFLLTISGVFIWFYHSSSQDSYQEKNQEAIEHALEQSSMEAVAENEEEEAENRIETLKARDDYFFRLMRDPATNAIPKNIRARELNHARKIPSIRQVSQQFGAKNPSLSVAEGFNWQLAGPPAVGGRTRALGIDQRNSDIIIAGAVSGGIWKSNDGGDSWDLKTPNLENYSVTSLAQDPTSPDTWYYVAGEYLGNSASANGASYYGTGVYRSTNNGETWAKIPGTSDTNTSFNTQFDFVTRIRVSPTTGTVFMASNGVGIYRAPNGQDFDNLILGGLGEHAYADVAVASDGRVASILSSVDAGSSDGNPGLYISDDDGITWTDITPNSFPSQHARSVLKFASSDPNILYVFTYKGGGSNQGVSFYKIDLSGDPATASDRAANLPDFGGSVGGLELQGGYNMTLAVKPDDPDVVTLGGTNLYRSFDGFSTAPSGNSNAEKDEFWIGGYAKTNNVSSYPNQHPDQHIQVYDPSDPDRLWSGNDGGLSVTNDVGADAVTWDDKNEGYIVTQFYDASIPEEDPNDTNGQKNIRLMGGAQDNGTPFFRFEGPQTNPPASFDISSGDGANSFFTKNYIFVSNQNGIVRRWNTDSDGNIANPLAYVHPSQATGQLFVHPYAVDPNNETIMYYPSTNTNGTPSSSGDDVSTLFRNTEIDQISNQNNNGTTTGWEELNRAELPSSYIISALHVSTKPANILYYAGSSSTEKPVIKKIINANTSNQTPTDISIPNAPSGAYVSSIAVNAGNGNNVLVTMSNYNIVGLYHTMDGGTTWQAVEGNLEGSGESDPGPSIRSATIVPSSSGPVYLVATSTGVYGSQNLDGDNTQWGREASDEIGFAIAEDITSRLSNGDVAVGSHGRGMFLGSFQGTISVPDIPSISIDPIEARVGEQVTITATDFQFSSTPSNNDVFFGSERATVDQATSSQLVVTVPSGAVSPSASDRSVLVSVTNNNGQDPQDLPFTILRDAKISINPTKGRVGDQVTINAANFQFSTTASNNDVFFANSKATVVQATSSQLTVEVPSVSIDPDASQRSVLVSVKNNNGPDPQEVSFIVLNMPVITVDTPNGGEAQGQPGDEVTITAKSFKFNSDQDENMVYFDDELGDNDDGVRADVVSVSSDNREITVEVPRGALSPSANDREVNIRVVNPDGVNPDPIKFMIQPPEESSLGQNYPNPFGASGATTIPISLQNASHVTIVIYDVTGQRVGQPVKDKQYQAGTYNIPVDFSGKASGIYIYRIVAKPNNGSANTFVDSKKFTFIK